MHKEYCYNLFWSAKKKLKIKNLYVVSELVIWSGDQNTCRRMYYVYVFVELVSKELNHFGVIAGLFRQILLFLKTFHYKND